MSLLLLVVLLLVLGGGGGWYGYRAYGPAGGGLSLVGLVLVVIVLWALLGHRV